MEAIEFGNRESDIVLIQPTVEQTLGEIDKEIEYIRQNVSQDFRFVVVIVDDWNKDLSPWEAPAVFGKDGFGKGAGETLDYILQICSDKRKRYYLGGYSLAGLFSLWAAYQTDIFAGVAAASPSVWFPGFSEYMSTHEVRCKRIYLSLGDKEEKTRNPVMATVADRIRDCYHILQKQNVECVLEWNKGNHFKDTAVRCGKAFVWILKDNGLEEL